MCPLPFTLDRMYNFVSDRFDDPSAYVQEQSLQWLQVRPSSVLVHAPSKIKYSCLGSRVYDLSLIHI